MKNFSLLGNFNAHTQQESRELSLIWFLELMNVEHMEVLYLEICIEWKTKVAICFIIEIYEKNF